MLEHIHQKGGEIDAIMVCPHGPDDDCACRKPKPGLFLELAHRLKINLNGVPAVGDSLRDVKAAQAAHASPVLVKTGKNWGAQQMPAEVPTFDDLSAFANEFLRTSRTRT